MTFKVKDDIQAKLNEWGTTYSCSIISAEQDQKTKKMVKVEDPHRKYKVVLIDKLTKQAWGDPGYGAGKEAALQDAVSRARPEDDKPMTTPQLAEENKRLRAQLTAIQNPEMKVEGKETIKAIDRPRTNSVNGKKVAVASGD